MLMMPICGWVAGEVHMYWYKKCNAKHRPGKMLYMLVAVHWLLTNAFG
jgi:hypothetical protein